MRQVRILTRSALALALFIIMAAAAYAAPGATDEIQGTIKDALGRPLSGVSLTLKSPDETIVGKTQSDADGQLRVFRRNAGHLCGPGGKNRL